MGLQESALLDTRREAVVGLHQITASKILANYAEREISAEESILGNALADGLARRGELSGGESLL